MSPVEFFELFLMFQSVAYRELGLRIDFCLLSVFSYSYHQLYDLASVSTKSEASSPSFRGGSFPFSAGDQQGIEGPLSAGLLGACL